MTKVWCNLLIFFRNCFALNHLLIIFLTRLLNYPFILFGIAQSLASYIWWSHDGLVALESVWCIPADKNLSFKVQTDYKKLLFCSDWTNSATTEELKRHNCLLCFNETLNGLITEYIFSQVIHDMDNYIRQVRVTIQAVHKMLTEMNLDFQDKV